MTDAQIKEFKAATIKAIDAAGFWGRVRIGIVLVAALAALQLRRVAHIAFLWRIYG